MNRESLLFAMGRLARETPTDSIEPFEPLDEAAQDRIAEKLCAQIQAKLASHPASPSSRLPAAPPPSVGVVVPMRPRQPPRAIASLAVLAVAAAATGLVVGLQGHPPSEASAQPVSRAAIPDYQVEVTGGDVLHGTRAADSQVDAPRDNPTLLAAGASLSVVLRPERPAPAHAAMIACVLRDGVSRPWSVAWSRSEQGSFQARGTREALFAGQSPGELTLLFAVRPEGSLPTCEELSRAGSPLRHAIHIL